MLIDWFTVGAQALNFVILAWLMKRLLYKPILDAIDAREKRIATELSAASRKRSEAQQERDEFHKKNADLEQQRAALLQKARADADAERQTLMDAARQAADTLAAKRQDTLAREAKALLQALRQRTQTEVFAIARKALTDLADARLEASACARFIARLHDLEGQPRDALAAALGATGDAIVVRSAFDLPSAQRRAIHKAIVDSFGVKVEPRYATEPGLVAGIELVVQGQKFAWTIDNWLASLERGVDDLLQAQRREAAASPVLATEPSETDPAATAPPATAPPATAPPATAPPETDPAAAELPAVAAAKAGPTEPAVEPLAAAASP